MGRPVEGAVAPERAAAAKREGAPATHAGTQVNAVALRDQGHEHPISKAVPAVDE